MFDRLKRKNVRQGVRIVLPYTRLKASINVFIYAQTYVLLIGLSRFYICIKYISCSYVLYIKYISGSKKRKKKCRKKESTLNLYPLLRPTVRKKFGM